MGVRQAADAGGDAYLAARDQVIVNNYAGAARAAAAVPGLLPRDVPGFTGREDELDRLTGLASGSVVVTAIDGTAGVGKTALAIHAAYRLLPRFPDGQLYADLRGYTEGQDPAEPGEVLEVFLRRLGVPAGDLPSGLDDRSGLLRQLLASRRVLMVLDNVAAETQVRPLLPGAGATLVLITSRVTLAGLEVDQRIDLDVLPADQATALLARLIGPERAASEPAAVGRIRDWCGCLPLALRIAGQLLAVHPKWAASHLAEMLADERHRLSRLKAGDRQVRAAFALSYRQLPAADARMFRLLGLHPGPDIDLLAAASLAGLPSGEAGQILDRLSLVHLIAEDTSGRFRMHDLLRLFARQTCQETDTPAAREAALTRVVGYFSGLARFLDSSIELRPDPAGAETAGQAGKPPVSPRQALAMFEAERLNLTAVLGLAAEQNWHEHVCQLSEYMSDALTLRRHLDDLFAVHQIALNAARRSGNTGAQIRALDSLGNAYQDLQRFEEAIDCYQDALAIRTTGNRSGESITLSNLGNAYEELRRFDEAIDCYQEALAIDRQAGDRHGVGLTLNNLGNVYQDLRRFGDAVACYENALAICRETGDRHGEGQTLNNLGNAYQQLSRFDEAITCYQQDLAICRETGDRHGEGQTLNNLGNAYQDLRRFDKAISSYQEALAIRRETGNRHGEGITLSNLGSACHDTRRLDQAASYWHAAARALHDTGNHEEAKRLERQAAKIHPHQSG